MVKAIQRREAAGAEAAGAEAVGSEAAGAGAEAAEAYLPLTGRIAAKCSNIFSRVEEIISEVRAET